MDIQIAEHAMQRAEERGVAEEEIYDTFRTGVSLLARGDRFAKEKVYLFQKEWNKKFYEEKHVKVIYVAENNLATVITVVVRFGNFTNPNK